MLISLSWLPSRLPAYDAMESPPLIPPRSEGGVMAKESRVLHPLVGGESELGHLQARMAVVQAALAASEREAAAVGASRAEAQA